jgi:hypothetical protein
MQTQPAGRTPTSGTAAWKRSLPRTVKPAGRFLAELGGMCVVAMCAGGGILSFAAFAIASGLGYPNLVQQSPELSAFIITVCLSLAMTVYMAVRGHGRRHNLEMTGSTFAAGTVVIVLLWSGVISTSGLHTWRDLFPVICGPACLVMVVEMLISFGMYSGRARQQRPAA